MQPLPVPLLATACRIFLTRAYPGGEATIPANRRAFLHIDPSQPLEALLVPTVCQTLRGPGGTTRGYALRLGSATYPHLKLQAIDCSHGTTWVFAVDTHDTLSLNPQDPDISTLAHLQTANRRLKKEIESAWEAAGLLTFNGLLRRELQKVPPQ